MNPILIIKKLIIMVGKHDGYKVNCHVQTITISKDIPILIIEVSETVNVNLLIGTPIEYIYTKDTELDDIIDDIESVMLSFP